MEKDFKITGPMKHVNPYLEKMINFWHETNKNLYSFLLTLDFNELDSMVDELILEKDDKNKKNNGKWSDIGRSLAIIAYSIEKGRYNGEFTSTIECFSNAINAFIVMLNLASSEKKDDIKVLDNSYFFDPENSLQITIINSEFLVNK